MRSPYKFACVRCTGRCIPNCSASKLRDGKQAMLYKYDQLNRITKSRSLAFGNNAYAARSGDQKYDEDYSYDANGNILTLNRKDDKAAVTDDFNYSYYANTNRLLKHKTAGGAYEYDAIGNLVKDNNENLSIAWTPSGKVRSVVKPDTTIYFRYDAAGNRIAKIVSTDSKSDTTAYVRDASGNVMTIYNNRTAAEAPIYGSGRIGEYMGKEKEGYQTFNLRKYELSNHLGNVMAVISDKVNLYGHNNVLDSARATVMSASDYYPFGLPMRGRTLDSAGYRFGFNGHEKDDEIAGKGNHLSWGDYGSDTRTGRRWQIDPEWQKLSGQSPYTVNNNSPVSFADPDGNWAIFIHYKFTRNALGSAGIPIEKARMIAHYASVYADHPMGTKDEKRAFTINSILSRLEFMNNKTDRSLLRSQKKGIDYSPTADSQTETEPVQKWHGTRTVRQADKGVTAEMAMAEGRKFGWGKVFEAASSGDSELAAKSTMANLGQGMHALQDVERHKGAVYSELIKERNEHSLVGDWLGVRASSREIANSAAKVFSIMSGIGSIGKRGQITTTGMPSEPRAQLISKLSSSGYSHTEKNGKIKYTKK